jgi:hypothetical protein
VSSLKPPTSPPGETQELKRLNHAKDAYQGLLDETKHQDDKIGRFLTVIAFLIAGALVFTSPEVLQARYAVGATHLRLPAIALITFLVLVVLSVLLYVLAIAPPLTIPSPPAARPGSARSHLFFLLIARETKWSWDQLWDASDEELERQLLREYQREALNIAQRVNQKFERLNDASALFMVALLFFLLSTVLAVDVLQHAKPSTGAALQAPTDLDWSTPLRATVATILGLFAAALVSYRLRAAQIQRFDALVQATVEGRRVPWWNQHHLLLLAYPIFTLATLVPGAGHSPLREAGAGLAALAAVAGGIGYLLILRRPAAAGETSSARHAHNASAALSLVASVALAAAAWLAVHRGWPLWQLSLALGAAVSPLGWSVSAASRELHKRARWHLAAEPAVSALAPDGPGQPGGDGGPA